MSFYLTDGDRGGIVVIDDDDDDEIIIDDCPPLPFVAIATAGPHPPHGIPRGTILVAVGRRDDLGINPSSSSTSYSAIVVELPFFVRAIAEEVRSTMRR